MRILIIEDEESAVDQLKNLIRQLVDQPVFEGTIDNIEDAVDFLSSGASLDLIFLDIHLSDGLSFEIFKEVHVDVPVIFTTAYDEYAIWAFDVNSIGYLLKPIRKEKLEKVLEKLRRIESRHQFVPDEAILKKITDMVVREGRYKRNFLVPHKDRLIPVSVEEIAWFEIKNGVVAGMKWDNKRLVMEEKSLEELTEVLDPAQFYRANRQFLISRKSIREIEYYFNSRLFLRLLPAPDEKVLISKARASHFKDWMNRQ
ncbi:MAG: LytTR family DNA-binding domain-containing protein [Prolixibacteraceae bacterium]